ncbi:hypothetical protein OAQ99_01045 [Candidatus Kapabacteria bacterium]|nr:hypothetical protein [Candidatus Kapabacteria bacterium]
MLNNLLIAVFFIFTGSLFSDIYHPPEGYIIASTDGETSQPGKVDATAPGPNTDSNDDFVDWNPKCYGFVDTCWEIRDGGKTLETGENITVPSGQSSTSMPPIILEAENQSGN